MSINHFRDPHASRIVVTSAWRALMVVTNDACRVNIATAGLLAKATGWERPVARYMLMIAPPGYPL